jgi:ATP-dependent DNA helicase RecG
MFQTIRSELEAGKQAYFIFPLIEESEAEGFDHLKSAILEAERLQTQVFPEYKVGLMHGGLKPQEKAEVMELFLKNKIHILVSTTVVEVGVDVPNATLMVIENSERFGLSQLHQLRGRVGRGSFQSYCFLLTSKGVSESGHNRLSALEETQDGFRLSEIDLEIRGPGEFLGTRQAGDLPFRMANLVRDHELLVRARNEAIEVLKTDPEFKLTAHEPLRNYYQREGRFQAERLKT